MKRDKQVRPEADTMYDTRLLPSPLLPGQVLLGAAGHWHWVLHWHWQVAP